MSKTTTDRSEIRQATIELLDLESPPSDGSQIKGGVGRSIIGIHGDKGSPVVRGVRVATGDVVGDGTPDI
jgi:hypothetical protein